MKLMSKFTVGIPAVLNAAVNTPLGYFWRIMRIYAFKPEVLVCCTLLAVMLLYIQAVDPWSRMLFEKIQYTLGRTTSKVLSSLLMLIKCYIDANDFFVSFDQVSKLQFLVNDSVNNGVKLSWELKQGNIAAYAVQGHRARMEDRFVVNENLNNTGVSLFAVFDGHGGEVSFDLFNNK